MGMSRLQIREAELAKSRSILRTIHGSHLYGLAHSESDIDTYEVVLGCSKNFAWNRNEEEDANHIHLNRFQQAVENGAPQALEALFSPEAEIAPGWEAFFAGCWVLRPARADRPDAQRVPRRRSHGDRLLAGPPIAPSGADPQQLRQPRRLQILGSGRGIQ